MACRSHRARGAVPARMRTLDQAESYPPPGQPERRRGRAEHGHERLEHPVVVGYDGSSCRRNPPGDAAGVARRLSRPLLVVHVSSTGMYCEPLTGQVIGLPEHGGDLEKWLGARAQKTTPPPAPP